MIISKMAASEHIQYGCYIIVIMYILHNMEALMFFDSVSCVEDVVEGTWRLENYNMESNAPNEKSYSCKAQYECESYR